jgi:twitching motility two-component system response regulator PilG
MQGNLNNPYKLLQLIAQRELTGCVSISIPEDSSTVWKLYVGGARLYFATVNGHHPERFNFIWKQINHNSELPNFDPDKSEYENLYTWQVDNHLSLTEFRQILLHFSREAIIQAISHSKAYVKFEPRACIKPVLIAAPLADLVSPITDHISFWRRLHTYIPSPFSKVYLAPNKIDEFSNCWDSSSNTQIGEGSARDFSLATWVELLEQRLNIYEICDRLGAEPHALSLFLYSLIEKKILEVLNSETEANTEIISEESQQPLIACIDDSNTVQKQVKMVLEASGFRVLGITDPTSCLTSLIRQKPALILMDITMPEIDGYELCNMLRQSRQMKSVPIVMFTGRDGIIDRMRAQLVGANDYITKPVNVNTLLTKVQKLIQNDSKTINQINQQSLKAL